MVPIELEGMKSRLQISEIESEDEASKIEHVVERETGVFHFTVRIRKRAGEISRLEQPLIDQVRVPAVRT